MDMPTKGKRHGVATISRLHTIIGLFCRISSLCRPLLQKKPIISSFKEPLIEANLYLTAKEVKPEIYMTYSRVCGRAADGGRRLIGVGVGDRERL